MNNKVKFLRGTATEYEASTKDNDTFYYTTDTKKLYLGENEVGNGIDPKVIQAHIDNQTIHAKVWRGTQEEYNAIESKEDDTVYIIKDSDNTLADKLIDDTSTTATDKTWSAKKINENDEVARTALNAHAGNAEIHVTTAEKAGWNAKADLSDIPDKLPANGGNADTSNSVKTTVLIGTAENCAYSSIIDWANNTSSNAWACVISAYGFPTDAPAQNEAIVSLECDTTTARKYVEWKVYAGDQHNVLRRCIYGTNWNGDWFNVANGGDADTLDGLHANEISSNPNLLINPDFRINQRKAGGTITTPGYFVDRWKLVDGTVIINSDGSLWLNGTIQQTLESAVGTDTFASASTGTVSYDDSTNIFTLTASGEVISWAKLEIGSLETQFVSPDPTTELLKCQRYYQRYYANEMPNAFRVQDSSYSIQMNIPNMRATPAVRYHWVFGSYDNILSDGDNASHTAVFTTSAYTNYRAVRIVISTDASTPTGYLPADENSYCELESEI